MDSILIFDVGLTNAKTVLFSPEGGVLARASAPYPTHAPRQGWCEQETGDWWAALREGAAAVAARAPEAWKGVAGVSVTGHMHSLVAVDRDGAALGPAIVLGDNRGGSQVRDREAREGQGFFHRITGARLDTSIPFAKLCWIGEQDRDRWERASHWMSCKDFLRARMTGDRLTDPMDATGMGFFDLEKNQWSETLCSLAGLPRERLPVVVAATSEAGTLLGGAAAELGLPRGLPVMVGAGDDIEVLGFGVDRPGRALEHFGTTGSILACSERPCFDPASAVEVYPHPIPGLWLLGGSISSAGASRAWAANLFGAERIDPAGLPQDRSTGDRPPLFIPHLRGSRCPDWNPEARGAWVDLSAGHRSGDLYQAVLEGCTHALRVILDRIEQLTGQSCELRISPHDREEEAWRILRASVYGRSLHPLDAPEPTALGAMMVTAVGLGWFADIPTACRELVHPAPPILPEPRARALYQTDHRRYRWLEKCLGEVPPSADR
jgi:xylulokinase